MSKDRRTRTSSISWASESVRSNAKDRAESLGMSLSAYMNYLVARDLRDGGDFVIPVNGKKKGQLK